MADQKIPTIIVSKPGPLLDGLSELLNAMPQVHLVGVVENSKQAAALLKSNQRVLILLEHSQGQIDEAKELHAIKNELPNAICMMIVGDVEHRNIALAAGADWAELTGFPATALYGEILRLLQS